MRGKRFGKYKLAAVAIVAILAVAGFVYYGVSVGMFQFGIQGAEGPQVPVLGFQPAGTNAIYGVEDPSMATYKPSVGDCSSYAWISTVSISCSPQGTTLSWQITVPQSQSQNFGGFTLQGSQQGQPIDYWVSGQNGKTHVFGTVMEDQFTIELDANGCDTCMFAGVSLWLQPYVNIWSVQSCDISNESGTTCANGNGYVWGAPLQMQVSQCVLEGSTLCSASNISPAGITGNSQTEPGETGSYFTLYTGVSSSAPIGTGINPSTSSSALQQSFQSGTSPLAPDKSMNQYAETPLTLVNFGPYGCGTFGTTSCQQKLDLTVNIWYLVIGSFIWSNPSTQTLVPTKPNNGTSGSIPNCIFFTCPSLANLLGFPNLNLSEILMIAGIVVIAAVGVVVLSVYSKGRRGAPRTK